MLFASCFLLAALLSRAQAPVFNSVTPNSNSVLKFDKFELSINLTASYSNAYDYNDIAVQCIFSAPSGRKDTVDGFYTQDYSLNTSNGSITPSGPGLFKLRYAPNETGNWSYVLSCKNAAGTTTQPAQSFACTASATAGFIRRNSSNYLGFDNGMQFIPLGQNECWQNSNVYNDYTNWLTKLAGNGGNFIRIWMSDWAFALEWKNGSNGFEGLKKYKQSSAFWLDWLLDYCRQKGIYLMLCINHHGQVSTTVNPEWSNNPYNASNGGPCSNTWDFFTNSTARDHIQNRLRYLVARYGYSVNIQSWELFNEVEWTDNFSAHKTEITDWHNLMAGYIKSKDVYKHLVTTSYAQDQYDAATWNLPNIDFTQTHYYVNAPNIESVLGAGAQSYLSQFGKPTINGEYGLSGDGNTTANNDPNGTHLHNSVWASTFSGAMGSGMTWWWDNYVEPKNLYYHYKPLSQVVSGISFKDDNYKRSAAGTAGGSSAADVSISPGANFVKSPANNFTIDASGNMTPGATQLSSYLFGNVYNTQYRNPPTFNITYPVAGQFKVVVTNGSQGTSPQINIYLDGTEVLSQNAGPGATYTVSVPAGAHAIKVDNLGTDWVNIASYVFTNAGSPLTVYNLKSASNAKAAGWVLNNQYNWKYLQDHGNAAPPAVSGASVNIPGMSNGMYTVNLYSCSTGALLNTLSAQVSGGTLQFALPAIGWDLAYLAVNNNSGALPLKLAGFWGEAEKTKNNLYIKIERQVNVREVVVERSEDGASFVSIGKLDAASISDRFSYADNNPAGGNNFYRLRIVDNDGSFTYSTTILLKAGLSRTISIYPNPILNEIGMNLSAVEAGRYTIQVSDLNGRLLLSKDYQVNAGNRVISIPVTNFSKGSYFISVKDSQGGNRFVQKVVKQSEP